jgi:hypothetical protein
VTFARKSSRPLAGLWLKMQIKLCIFQKRPIRHWSPMHPQVLSVEFEPHATASGGEPSLISVGGELDIHLNQVILITRNPGKQHDMNSNPLGPAANFCLGLPQASEPARISDRR